MDGPCPQLVIEKVNFEIYQVGPQSLRTLLPGANQNGLQSPAGGSSTMAARDATKLLMSAQSPHATERPTGTPPVGKFAWTDRTSLPFDMDAIYVSCYSAGSVNSDANSLKTSRWADSSGVKAVATALRKMHDGKVSVERLAPVAQFIVNCTAWGKMKAAMLDEPRLMRKL